MKRIFALLLLLTGAILFSGCGGGGGGAGAPFIAPTHPTKATITLFTQGTLTAGGKVAGVDVTIHLPAGVTAKSTTNPPETDAGVTVASGLALVNSTLTSTYDGSARTVRVFLANIDGFDIGEFAKVTCDISGTDPTQADFSLSGIQLWDLDGATIASGATVGFTATIQ